MESARVRGFPLLQSLLVLVAILLAGVPVYRLTRPAVAAADPVTIATPAADATPAASPAVAPLELEALFAPAPADFQIKNLGQTVLAGQGPQARFTGHWTATLPPDGVDLVVQAHWPADAARGPAAAKLTVLFPDGRRIEKSFWADASGALTDVCTLPGAASPADPAP